MTYPPLPEPTVIDGRRLYTAGDMREYGQRCFADGMPLSDVDIKQAAIEVADALWGDGDVGWTDADGDFYRGFVRAIERRIIGDTP